MHHHPAHVLTHAHMEAIWAEQHVIHLVAIALLLLARARGIALLAGLSLEQLVIHKVVTELELHVPTHVILEDLSLVQHVIFPRGRRPIIHVLMGAPSLVLHAHSLHQELRNMDAPMEEHKAVVYASCPQDNACPAA